MFLAITIIAVAISFSGMFKPEKEAANLYFYNNTSDPLEFYIDDGFFGKALPHCSCVNNPAHLEAGTSYQLTAKKYDGTIVQSENITMKVGNNEWSVSKDE